MRKSPLTHISSITTTMMTMRISELRTDLSAYDSCNFRLIDSSSESYNNENMGISSDDGIPVDDQCSSTTGRIRQKKQALNYADPVDVERMRFETKKLLILCLQAQSPRAHTPTSQQAIEKMATALERILFQMSPTLADYSNVRTLETRLKIALPRARQLLRSSKRKQSNQVQTQELEEFLGKERYAHINELVESIRRERNELVGATCARCQYIRRIEGKAQLVGAASFGMEFPEPVKELFFGTPLVQIWDRKSVNTSWEPLVEKAQSNLEAFRRWKAENFECQRRV